MGDYNSKSIGVKGTEAEDHFKGIEGVEGFEGFDKYERYDKYIYLKDK